MTDENKITKLDISSTAIETGIDVAKSFVEKLVLPSVEELGLLVRDQISYWRFNNQIKILTKARAVCDKNNISIKAIPPKLLCPYLEYASLEDDPDIQNNWAILLANMADSRKNIQNHVFPYILSQLSKEEFKLLESVFLDKRERVTKLELELHEFNISRPELEHALTIKKTSWQEKLDAANAGRKPGYDPEISALKSNIYDVEREVSLLKNKELMLKWKISTPQSIPEESIKEFEMANIVRLGLAKVVYEASAGTHSIDIPDRSPYSRRSVDFDIQIETETKTILTELGELFLEACCDQHV